MMLTSENSRQALTPELYRQLLHRQETAPKKSPGLGSGRHGPKALSAKPLKRWTSEVSLNPMAGFRGVNWIAPDALARRMVTLINAVGGSGKSTWIIWVLVLLAAGIDPFSGKRLKRPQRVVYFSGEDDLDLIQARIAAVLKNCNLTDDDIGDRFRVSTVIDTPFLVANQTGARGIVRSDADIRSFAQELKATEVDVVAFDPLGKFIGVSENDNTAMNIVMSCFSKIAYECNAAILIAHHSAKMRGNDDTGENSRGASSVRDAARIAFTFNVLSVAKADQFGVEPQDRWRYIVCEHTKANLGRRTPTRYYYLKSVMLPGLDPDTGEPSEDISVGVVEPWSPSDGRVFPEALYPAIHQVLDRWDGDPFLAEHRANSTRWFGRVVIAVLTEAGVGLDQTKQFAVMGHINTLLFDRVVVREKASGTINRRPALCILKGTVPAAEGPLQALSRPINDIASAALARLKAGSQ